MSKKTSCATMLFFILFFFILFSLIPNSKEGFLGIQLPSFKKCRSKGYTKEFCLQTPLAWGQPGMCQCQDGSLGQILPGFRGRCICDDDIVALNEADYSELIGVETDPPSPYMFSYSPDFL